MIPECLLSIWRVLYLNLLEPGDDFNQTLRKLVALTLAMTSPFAAAGGAYWLVIGIVGDGLTDDGEDRAGAGTVIAGIITLLTSVLLFGNYIAVRRIRHVTDQHMTGIIYALLPLCCGLTFGLMDFDIRLLMMCVTLVAMISQSTHVILQTIFCVIIQFVSCYNEAYRTLQLPGSIRKKTSLETLGEGCVITLVSIIVAVAVYLQTRTHTRQVTSQHSAIEMSRTVVQLCRQYDTDGVTVALDKFQSSGVDPELLREFRALRDNLDLYKPFLPNYVFHQEDKAEDKLEGSGSGSHGHTPSSLERSFDRSHRRSVSGGVTGVETPEVLDLDDGSLSEGSISKDSDSDLGGPSSMSFLHRFAGSSTAQNVLRTRLATTMQAFTKKISLSLVDCRMLFGSERLAKGPEAVEVDLTRFVDSIYQAAQQTKGAVHSFVGDTVQVTWNAVSRVAQPEVSAAKFLCRVINAAGGSGCCIGGVAFSGAAQCINVSSCTKTKAQLVHAPWMGGVYGGLSLARRYQTAIIDGNTQLQTHFDVHTRGVDQLKYLEWGKYHHRPPILMCDGGAPESEMVGAGSIDVVSPNRAGAQAGTSPGAAPTSPLSPMLGFDNNPDPLMTSILYECVSEVNHKEDEWMYQVHTTQSGKADNSHTLVSKALEAAIKQNYGEAMTLFQKLEAEESMEKSLGGTLTAPLVRRLHAYCERKLNGKSSASAATTTNAFSTSSAASTPSHRPHSNAPPLSRFFPQVAQQS